jgi:hypothetical protein
MAALRQGTTSLEMYECDSPRTNTVCAPARKPVVERAIVVECVTHEWQAMPEIERELKVEERRRADAGKW